MRARPKAAGEELRDPWTVARQAPLSMGFFRQEYWSGLPFLSPGDGPRPGTEPGSPALQADSLPAEPQGKSSIRVTLCDPVDGSPPGSPSLGFSGREHWSGLPFPSPVREREVAQSCPTLREFVDCSPPGSSVPGILRARTLEWAAIDYRVSSRQLVGRCCTAQGLSSVLCDDLEAREEVQEGGDACIPMAASRCCTAETNATL